MIELNRPQMFMAGIIVLLLGMQLRWVESIVLNEQATKFITERTQSGEMASTSPNWFATQLPQAKKTITPPKWIGYSMLSIGGVIVLHAYAMRKNG